MSRTTTTTAKYTGRAARVAGRGTGTGWACAFTAGCECAKNAKQQRNHDEDVT